MNAQTDIKSGSETAPAFVTGRGQSDTHAVTLNDGRQNPSKDAGKPYSTITGREIAAMVQNPPAVPKEQGPWFIPSTYHQADARSHDAQRLNGEFLWLPLDVDQNNLALDDVRAALDTVAPGASKMIYSTRSTTPENRKWRGLIPLKTAIKGQDYHDVASAFCDLLEDASGGVLIPDRKLTLPGQLVYLPNRGAHYEYHLDKAARLDLTPDHPIMQRVAETRRLRAEAEREAAAERARRAARRAAQAEDSDSPVDHFNQRHSVEDLLLKYGYKRAGHSQDYRSPAQYSGSYATRCYGEYWISLSGSDAAQEIGNATANDNRFGDAFDLYVHFEHGGDFTKAVNAYAREVQIMRPQDTEEDPLDGFEKVEDAPTDTASAPPSPPGGGSGGGDPPDDEGWMAGLLRNSRGTPFFNTANVMHILRHHPKWQGRFAFDEFRQVKMILKPIPGTKASERRFKPRDFRDADAVNAVTWFNRAGFATASKNIIYDAIDAVMEDNTSHPVREWLESLPAPDSRKLLDTWLFDFCGVVPTSDKHRAYVREVGRKWLISAVARIMKPGCKADYALILEGGQGAGKSTTLRILCGDEWFGDALPNMASKDASDYLRGKWVIEMAELSNINKSEVEVVKAFISRTEERFRPAYARAEITYPRQCVFAGSTNKTDYLRDETGNRRFWPVRVSDKCDLKGIRAARAQLWAEALAAFRDGEEWWLSEGVIETAKDEQEMRVAQDAWSTTIMDFCLGKEKVSPTQIAREALQLEITKIDRMVTNRITAVLAGAGWGRSGILSSGQYKGQAAYSRAAP